MGWRLQMSVMSSLREKNRSNKNHPSQYDDETMETMKLVDGMANVLGSQGSSGLKLSHSPYEYKSNKIGKHKESGNPVKGSVVEDGDEVLQIDRCGIHSCYTKEVGDNYSLNRGKTQKNVQPTQVSQPCRCVTVSVYSCKLPLTVARNDLIPKQKYESGKSMRDLKLEKCCRKSMIQ